MRALAAVLLAALPALAQEIRHEKDIPYDKQDGVILAMDVLRPDTAGRLPAIVLVHGGGFSSGTRQGFLDTARRLALRGYVAASISYRLTPRFQFPAPVHDAKTAVRFLRANADRFQLDPERIGAIGVSAGGTIALFLGVSRDSRVMEGRGPYPEYSSSVDCVVNLYGRSDMTTAYGGSRNAATAVPPLVGGELPWMRQGHVLASPLAWVTPATAPVQSIHGTLDLNVPYQQSVDLHERLRAAGVVNALETIEGAGHGFKGADQDQADAAMYAFFDRHLKPPADRFHLSIRTGGDVVTMGWPSGRVVNRQPAGSPPAASALLWDARGPLRLGSVSGIVALRTGGRIIADRTGRRIVELDKAGVPVHELRDLAFAPEGIDAREIVAADQSPSSLP